MFVFKSLLFVIVGGFTILPALSVDSIQYRLNKLYRKAPTGRSSSHFYSYSPPATYLPSSPYKKLVSVYEACNLEFAFPTEAERTLALTNGNYNPEAPIPIDVDVYYSKHSELPRIFVTIPRFGPGVPYSLAQLTNVLRSNDTELTAFPNYYWHNSHGVDCDGLTSVYRVQIDSCGRMWILDSGEINEQYCNPQIVVIDLETNTLVHRYRLPEYVFKRSGSRFVKPLIDIADNAPHGSCNKAMVYMADVIGNAIVVYDVQANRSWRIQNKYTFPDPDFGTHTIAGQSFELLDGVFGLTITPKGLGLRRMLFFHALSNDAQVAVPLDVVNNYTNWKADITSALDEFILVGKRGVQCAASAMTSQGILLCGFLEPIAIVGWNIRTSYRPQNRIILAENPYTLQFVSGLKVIRNREGKEEVWMVSNRLQKSFSGTLNYREINYRIQRCGVDELLLGSECN